MKRDTFFENLRGIAIITVVLIHTIPVDTTALLILRQVFNFAVPMFLFLSGYFIRKDSVFDNGRDFIIKRIMRILIPYFVWSILTLIFIQKLYGFNIKTIIVNLATGQVVNIYYYIIVLLQLILITPLIVRLEKIKFCRMILWSITPISLLVFYWFNLVYGKTISYPWYALPFVMWFVFYYYGYLLGNNKHLETKIFSNIKVNIILYIVFLGLSMVEGYIINSKFGLLSFASSQIKISSFLASLFLINTLFGFKKYIKNGMKVLEILGNASFGIYLIHYILLSIVNKFFGSKIPPVLLFLVLLTSSMIVIVVTKRIVGRKYSKKILGF